jgi:hypothetical protein
LSLGASFAHLGFQNINEHHEKLGHDGTLPDAMNVDFDTFQRLADEHIIIMSQIFGRKQVIPEFEDFCKHIREIFLHCKPLSGGKVGFRFTGILPFGDV